MVKLVAVALATALCVALAAPGKGWTTSSATDECIQPGDTPVHMKTGDGVSIYGLEVGSGTTGVVLAHQYFGHADGSMLVLYAWLRLEAGLAPDVAFEEAVKRATGVRRADVRDLLPTPAVA